MRVNPKWGGGGVLPYISHIGMCCSKRYGSALFWSVIRCRLCPLWSGVGYGFSRKLSVYEHIYCFNRPRALWGHATNTSLKQLVGILLMPKIDRAQKWSYMWNLRGKAFKGDILWHFDFSTKQYDLYWPPCWRAYSCPPTWWPTLHFAYILLNFW